MALTRGRLAALGIEPWLTPRGGLFLWCRLPDELDAGEIARHALAEGIVLAPGNAFSLSQAARHFMRFNVAQSADPKIFSVLRQAMRGLRGLDPKRTVRPPECRSGRIRCP